MAPQMKVVDESPLAERATDNQSIPPSSWWRMRPRRPWLICSLPMAWRELQVADELEINIATGAPAQPERYAIATVHHMKQHGNSEGKIVGQIRESTLMNCC